MNNYTRKILQAILDGETIEVNHQNWEPEGWRNILKEIVNSIDTSPLKIRIKPKTITLAGVEFPEPMREEPENGTKYFVATNIPSAAHGYTWLGESFDLWCLKSGVCQATKGGAELQRKAMILSVGGEL